MDTNKWQFTARFAQKKIVVVGDFIIDEYLHGGSSRLSPEAPVPVVDVQSDCCVTGGAANVAVNLRALGAEVILCSVLGTDPDADMACKLAADAGIPTDFLVREAGRKTLVKTRVLADGHPLVRLDRGDNGPISPTTERKLLNGIQKHFATCDGIVVADYDKGTVTRALVD